MLSAARLGLYESAAASSSPFAQLPTLRSIWLHSRRAAPARACDEQLGHQAVDDAVELVLPPLLQRQHQDGPPRRARRLPLHAHQRRQPACAACMSVDSEREPPFCCAALAEHACLFVWRTALCHARLARAASPAAEQKCAADMQTCCAPHARDRPRLFCMSVVYGLACGSADGRASRLPPCPTSCS